MIIPFSLIALLNQNLFFLTLVAGTVSLFPLLFTPFEIVLKAVLTVFHASVASQIVKPKLNWYQTLYILGFLPVYIFENLGDALIPKLPFLPLLLVSDYTFLGIGICYLSLYWKFVTNQEQTVTTKKSLTPREKSTPQIQPDNVRVLRQRSTKNLQYTNK